MTKVLLDTNFILSGIRKKIDFFEEISFMGFKIIIPIQVINEIKRLSISKKKLKFREEASFALKLLEKNNFEKIDLKYNYVDKGIKKFIEKNPKIIVATLDSELKKKLKKKLIIRGQKLELQ
ncbi:MAG: PIN domain-containing protein [Nanoarchaeota archaeon]